MLTIINIMNERYLSEQVSLIVFIIKIGIRRKEKQSST